MTVLSRGATGRRSSRRPSWLFLTALLVLAIVASSALVFTNRVDLLRLAVILALWASIIAAFVSLNYRREADADKVRARDLKRVYDLQLDREVSARREYELSVESRLRRELASELRTQAADDVAALRAELAALRTSLEILFDTELDQRPALETDGTHRGYGGWSDGWSETESTPADWVSTNRVESVREHDADSRMADTAIIDVPEEPLPLRHVTVDDAAASPAEPVGRQPRDEAAEWHNWPTEPTMPATARAGEEDQWRRPGRHSTIVEVTGEEPSHEPDQETGPEPSDELREDGSGSTYRVSGRRARHSTEDRDQGAALDTASAMSAAFDAGARHRTENPAPISDTPEPAGQSVADLLARLQAEPGGGGRRRRRRRA